ncbi:sugar kinase, partial [Streptomyces sp. SM14]|uniref:sugar kinase n=2 Tax=unclassified Streptomyces TaxID=2593676 RepID=UPI000CD4C14D
MPDVVCLGESLAAFRPARPGESLTSACDYVRSTGGAESNVACALAHAGHTVRWVSRLGLDGFGEQVLRDVAAAGVDVSAVARDPGRPTGIYFRTDGERGAGMETAYYRAGSAASAMSPATVGEDAVSGARVLHLTGITAALSPGCEELLRALTTRRPGRPLVSFDVNHRPQLWQGRDAGPVLRALANGADLVFVGEDEAEAVWGITGGPGAIRAALPGPAAVVVKGRGHEAVLLQRDGEPGGGADRGPDSGPAGEADGGPGAAAPGTPAHADHRTTRVPAPGTGHVVAPVGAGDAFAAGYLSALLDGRPAAVRLRHGHLFAAAALARP